MEPFEAIATLRAFNAWRRCNDGTLDHPGVKLIGQAIDEICDHAERMERELEQIKAVLADPLAVHLNMMRGTIQWTPANLRHLLGDCTPESQAP